MPEMPRMPEKPVLPPNPRLNETAAAPPRKRGRGARMVFGLIGLMLFAGCLGIFFVAAPQLAIVSLIVSVPFGLAALHYLIWGQAWSERIRAQVAAEEAAEIAAGIRRPEPDLPEDEPWLRGEERE
jgi:hypothetical protein